MGDGSALGDSVKPPLFTNSSRIDDGVFSAKFRVLNLTFYSQIEPPSPLFLLGLIHKAILKRVPNTIKINEIIGQHEPVRARLHRILICGVLIHATVTTGQQGWRVIIRDHHEQERVRCTLSGMHL